MADFITLACPSCAGQLKVTEDMDRFACRHCGREHLVKREAGHVELAPVVKHIERMSRTLDRQATELAIRRLRDDRKELLARVESRKRALWAAKGDAALIRRRLIRSFVAGVALAVASSIATNASREAGIVLLLFCGVAAVIFGLALISFPASRRAESESRSRLNETRDQLDECEDELSAHETAVRSS